MKKWSVKRRFSRTFKDSEVPETTENILILEVGNSIWKENQCS